jgi:bisphosphoglycerate-dependent phosphoglycerate mutase
MRPRLIQGKNLLVSCHGGSGRALAKIISNISNEDVM